MSKTQEEIQAEAVAGCFLGIVMLLLTPVTVYWQGFVMLQLYNWFVLPINGAPTMALGNMVGISLLLSMMLMGLAPSKSKDKSTSEYIGEALFKSILAPAIFWCFGWCYFTWFMR